MCPNTPRSFKGVPEPQKSLVSNLSSRNQEKSSTFVAALDWTEVRQLAFIA
jgi:hypothetical protein